MLAVFLSMTLASAAGDNPVAALGQFQPPVQVMADGEPIDVGRSRLALPYYVDFDGDGAKDLLVGEGCDGTLRIYRNYGTSFQPRFKHYDQFKVGADLGRVPSE